MQRIGIALVGAALLALAGCGGDDASDDGVAYAAEDEFDVSDLPDDFPTELIPPRYDTAQYMDLRHINGTRAASFESGDPIQDAIDHYTALLGEPKINVDAGDGDRAVQWHSSPYPPWIVGLMGSEFETIVAISTLPEE